MKFVIIGDLHGNMPKFYFNDFDAIIAPGDFCSDAPRRYMFEALKKRIENPEPDINWWDLVGKKRAKLMVKKSLSDGRKILEKLNTFNVPVYIIPGNWDWTKEDNETFSKKDLYKSLIKGLKNIKDLHYKKIDIGELELIGYGVNSGPEYPQYKEDLKRINPKKLKAIKKEYKGKLKKVSDLFKKAKKPVVFISHNVPFNTKLDKIINKISPRDGYHWGSVITREIIEKYQPLICIGAHMHEHFGKDKIGKTTITNSGYGSHVNTFLEIKNGRIKKLEFYRGK